MSAFPALFEEDYNETKDETKSKLHFVQKVGELAVCFTHKHYKGKFDEGSGQTV